MTGTLRSKTRPRPSPASRRFGYVIAIVINIVLIVIANNLLDWFRPRRGSAGRFRHAHIQYLAYP